MATKSISIEFPCDFPLKIIGVASSNFISDITEIILKHYPNTSSAKITSKRSKQSNYIAITVILHVFDQESLDALYHELTQYPGIKMVL